MAVGLAVSKHTISKGAVAMITRSQLSHVVAECIAPDESIGYEKLPYTQKV